MSRKREKLIRAVLWVGIAVLIITLMISVIMRTSGLNDFFKTGQVPHPETIDFGYAKNPVLTLLHILPGAVFILLGAMQFIKPLRSRHIKIHRLSGKIYIVLGFLIGITAILMGFKIQYGGITELSAVLVFGTWFLFSLGTAYIKIRRRNYAAHREWMIRAYSIGMAVATMRPIIGLFFAFTHIRFQDFFGITFWIAFILHAAVAESWIRYTRKNNERVVMKTMPA
jgi:uncharacterized membrane protein